MVYFEDFGLPRVDIDAIYLFDVIMRKRPLYHFFGLFVSYFLNLIMPIMYLTWLSRIVSKSLRFLSLLVIYEDP